MKIFRGDIYLANNFNFPGNKHVADVPKPVLIIQNNEKNHHSNFPLITVLPISTEKSEQIYDHDVKINKNIVGLSTDLNIMCGILKTIPKNDLIKKIGEIDTKTLEHVNDRVSHLLGFIKNVRNN